MPLPVFALAIVALFILLAVLGVDLAHRWGRRFQIAESNPDFGQVVGGPIGNVFALVLALVTLAIWENYDRVKNQVDEEASIVHNLYESLASYPAPVREPARVGLRRYAQRVITHEWSRMADPDAGTGDAEAGRLMAEVAAVVVAYRPQALGDLPLQQEVLAEITRWRSLRTARLEGGTPYLDQALWIGLDAGTVVLLAFCSLWRLPSRRDHLVMAVALGASLGLVFFLLLAYNHPFAGAAGIPSSTFQALPEAR